MSGGGGKGGSQSTTVEIPAWLEEAAQRNIARAEDISALGYVPYYGPDVAALTPMQNASFMGTNQAASAFGLQPAAGGMPQAQTFANGVQGYSSAPLFIQAQQQLQQNAPSQYEYLTGMFIDPVTGAPARAPFGPQQTPLPAQAPAAPVTGPQQYGPLDPYWASQR